MTDLQLLNTYPTNERRALEFYRTPDYAADIGARLASPIGTGCVLDPCAGDGSLTSAVRRRDQNIRVCAIELDAERARVCGATVGDALELEWPVADAVLMNPPFNIWQPFLEKALGIGYTRVVVLLRLGALAGQKRQAFWKRSADNRGITVCVLSKRPSFTGSGTDGADYAWIVLDRDLNREGVRWV